MKPNRPFYRIEFKEKVVVHITIKDKKTIKGLLKDVSASGVGFFTEHPIKEKEFTVSFQLEDRTFTFLVNVAREKHDEHHFYGCQIKEKNPFKIGELSMILLRIDTKRRKEALKRKEKED